MSAFGGISTALSALQAHRRALDVTGHNIANVNTAGYTRQRVDLEARPAPGTGSVFANRLMAGGGVEVAGTSRLADEFLTARVRTQTSSAADLQARADALTEVERLLFEPGETGLASKLNEMWNAWSTVAAFPTKDAPKGVLVTKAQAVIDALKTGQRGIDTQWTDTRANVEALTTELNGLTAGVARLNAQVVAATGDGAANDLMDQRDQLVTRIVELTGAVAVPKAGGVLDVYLDGNPIVAGVEATALSVAGATLRTDVGATGGEGPVRLVRADGTPAGTLGGGQIKGELVALNEVLPGAAASYDAVATALAEKVNTVYATASVAAGAPTAFFTGTGVADLAVHAALVADPGKVATGKAGGGPTDSSVALAVADLADAEDGPDELWNTHVVGVGVQVQAARSRAGVAATTLASAVSEQQSATAVSLDEETANLLVVQRAYEGAARVLTAVDQALDTLINRTGLVGR